MSEVFDNLKKSIEKNVKGAHVSVLADSEIATGRFMLSTPALDLNRILSSNTLVFTSTLPLISSSIMII